MGARASRFQENPVVPGGGPFGKDVPGQPSYRRARCSRPPTAASLMADLSESFEETLLGRPEPPGGGGAGPAASAGDHHHNHSLSSGIGRASPLPPAAAASDAGDDRKTPDEDVNVSPDPEAPPTPAPVDVEDQARHQDTPGRDAGATDTMDAAPPHRTFLERLLVWASAHLRGGAPPHPHHHHHQRPAAAQPWILNNNHHRRGGGGAYRRLTNLCPFCAKPFPGDGIEEHLLSCVTSPPLPYNMDVLGRDVGECCICLDELAQGETIARLSCLCVYHKSCIDAWAKVKPCCPEHPFD